MDFQCAFLLPISSDSKAHHERHQQFLCHSHPLIQCNVTKQINSKQIKSNCSGCNLPIKHSIFVCTKCGILLDKSCTALLHEITHPLHPHQPLKLIENLRLNNRLKCRGCKNTNCVFTSACSKCDFFLDPQCASTRQQMINSKINHHPLAFLEKNLRDLRCDACRAPCKKHFFPCMKCKFGLHLECHPLPQIIKHDCHCDPLTLTSSQITDSPDEDSNAEFYCNDCEKRRALDDPTYYCNYCKNCHFVVHIHCVISEIMHYIEKESPLAISYGEVDKGTVDAVDEEIVRDIFTAINRLIIDDQIDEDIAALQTRIQRLKRIRKQLHGVYFPPSKEVSDH